jgi:tRNA-binding protein
MDKITWNEFHIVELRSWTIIMVDDFPEARKPAYKITVDFWKSIGIKKTSAQVVDLYSKKDLIGKQIIWVVNFPIKQIWPFMSEFLITWFIQDDSSVVLAVPDKKINNWLKLS